MIYCIYAILLTCENVCDIDIVCNSYNTGKSALPDIYARCPRASAYISGKARVPVLQVIYSTSGTLKICPNLMLDAQPLYKVTDAGCDCGTLF